jgi:hypothetical protein
MLLRATSWYLIYVDPLTIDFATGGAVSRSLGGFSGIGWDASTARIAGTAGILLRSVVVSLFLVVALRHLRLPAGGITLMLLYDALLIAPATDQWLTIPAVVGAAAAGEAVWAWMQRGGLGGQDGEPACWVIGGLVPLVQTALMLTISGLTAGVVWTPHLLAGVPVAAGILGATVAVLAVPPAFLRFTEPVAGQR